MSRFCHHFGRKMGSLNESKMVPCRCIRTEVDLCDRKSGVLMSLQGLSFIVHCFLPQCHGPKASAHRAYVLKSIPFFRSSDTFFFDFSVFSFSFGLSFPWRFGRLSSVWKETTTVCEGNCKSNQRHDDKRLVSRC